MASQHPDIEKVLFTQEDIDGIVSRLGEEITRDYAGKDLVLIAVLRGAVVWVAGVRADERFKCTAATRVAYLLRVVDAG